MDPKGFKDTSSATGCGFKSVTDYVQRSRPQWIAMENVKTLVHARAVDGYKKPIYYILETMKKLGYFSAFDVPNTYSYGLPQSRTRVWMMFIRNDCLAPALTTGSILQMFRSFQLKACSLERIFLDDCEVPRGESRQAAMSSKDRELKWPEKFEEAKEKLGAVAWHGGTQGLTREINDLIHNSHGYRDGAGSFQTDSLRTLCGWAKERVDKMLLRIRSEKLLLPERELAILAVACVDLQVNFGMDPCKEELVVQVEPGN